MAWNKKNQEQENTEQPLTKADYDYLRAGMKPLSPRKIHGRTYGAWELFMESIGVIRIDEKGYMEVRNPSAYTKWNEANANIEFADWKEQEKLFAAFPDAKNEWWEKRHALFNEIRALLTKWKASST